MKKPKKMEKVKIKRVKRNQKKTTTKEKILAGLGVGTGLMGLAGGARSKPVAPKPFVRTMENTKQKSLGQKIKKEVAGFFTIPEARADGYTTALGMGGWDPDITASQNAHNEANSVFSQQSLGGQTTANLASLGATQAQDFIDKTQNNNTQTQTGQTGSGETETEGSALPTGTNEGENDGSGEGTDSTTPAETTVVTGANLSQEDLNTISSITQNIINNSPTVTQNTDPVPPPVINAPLPPVLVSTPVSPDVSSYGAATPGADYGETDYETPVTPVVVAQTTKPVTPPVVNTPYVSSNTSIKSWPGSSPGAANTGTYNPVDHFPSVSSTVDTKPEVTDSGVPITWNGNVGTDATGHTWTEQNGNLNLQTSPNNFDAPNPSGQTTGFGNSSNWNNVTTALVDYGHGVVSTDNQTITLPNGQTYTFADFTQGKQVPNMESVGVPETNSVIANSVPQAAPIFGPSMVTAQDSQGNATQITNSQGQVFNVISGTTGIVQNSQGQNGFLDEKGNFTPFSNQTATTVTTQTVVVQSPVSQPLPVDTSKTLGNPQGSENNFQAGYTAVPGLTNVYTGPDGTFYTQTSDGSFVNMSEGDVAATDNTANFSGVQINNGFGNLPAPTTIGDIVVSGNNSNGGNSVSGNNYNQQILQNGDVNAQEGYGNEGVTNVANQNTPSQFQGSETLDNTAAVPTQTPIQINTPATPFYAFDATGQVLVSVNSQGQSQQIQPDANLATKDGNLVFADPNNSGQYIDSTGQKVSPDQLITQSNQNASVVNNQNLGVEGIVENSGFASGSTTQTGDDVTNTSLGQRANGALSDLNKGLSGAVNSGLNTASDKFKNLVGRGNNGEASGYFSDTYSGGLTNSTDKNQPDAVLGNSNDANHTDLYAVDGNVKGGVFLDNAGNVYVQKDSGHFVYTGTDYESVANQLNQQGEPAPASGLYALNGSALTLFGSGSSGVTYKDGNNNIYTLSSDGQPVMTGLVVGSDGQGFTNNPLGLSQQEVINSAVDKNLNTLSENTGLTVAVGNDGLMHVSGSDWGSGETVMSQQAFATQVISLDKSGFTTGNFLKTVVQGGMALGTSGLSLGVDALTAGNKGNLTIDFSQPVILYNSKNGDTVVLDGTSAAFVDSNGVTKYEFFQQDMGKVLSGQSAPDAFSGNSIDRGSLNEWLGKPQTGKSGFLGNLTSKVAPIISSNNPGSAVLSSWVANSGTNGSVAVNLSGKSGGKP